MSPLDRTLCPGTGCPMRNDCFRARAIPLGRQDAFGRPPYDPTTRRCEHHIPLADLWPSEDHLRTQAYFRWVSKGRPEGRHQEHWDEVCREHRARIDAMLGPPVSEDDTP